MLLKKMIRKFWSQWQRYHCQVIATDPCPVKWGAVHILGPKRYYLIAVSLIKDSFLRSKISRAIGLKPLRLKRGWLPCGTVATNFFSTHLFEADHSLVMEWRFLLTGSCTLYLCNDFKSSGRVHSPESSLGGHGLLSCKIYEKKKPPWADDFGDTVWNVYFLPAKRNNCKILTQMHQAFELIKSKTTKSFYDLYWNNFDLRKMSLTNTLK